MTKADRDVTLIARGRHLAAMQEKGLAVEKMWDGTTEIIPVKAMDMEHYDEQPDVVLVCVKGYSLEDTIPFIQRVAKPSTIVIPVLNIYGTGAKMHLDDLGHIVVSTTSGVPVFLSDIGSLKYGNLERKGVLGYTDRMRNYSESLEGIVLLLKHENPSQVLAGIHAAVDELNHETLPEGVHIHTFLDRTSLVDTTLSTVSHTLLMGMALVIIVLILFLWKLAWRNKDE